MASEALTEELILNGNETANQLVEEAKNAVQSATTAVQQTYNLNLPWQGYQAYSVEFGAQDDPDSGNIEVNNLELPEIPLYAELEPIDPRDMSDNLPEVPSLSSSTLTQLTKPDGDVDTFDEDVPNINTSVREVAVPTLDPLSPLNLLTVNLPTDIPEVTPPIFSARTPEFLGGDLPDLKAEFRSAREDAQARIDIMGEEKLDAFMAEHFPGYAQQISDLDAHVTAILNGTATAWQTTTSSAIYNLQLARVNAAKLAAEKELNRLAAKRGNVNSRAISAARKRLIRDTHANVTTAAFEVAEKQADRETQHLQVVLQLSNSLRGVAINAWIAYNRVILEQNQAAVQEAQLIVDACATAYNLAIARFNADINVYRAEADVFEAKLKSALVDFEIARERLLLAKSQIDVNESLIKVRESELRERSQQIDLYTAEIRGIAAELALRRLPLEIFEAEVRAYQAYVQARELEVTIYRAALEGQGEVRQQDLIKLRGYEAELQAFKTKIETIKDRQSIQVGYNDELRTQVALELQRIASQNSKVTTNNQARLEQAAQNIDKWREQNRIELSDAERLSADERAKLTAKFQYDRLAGDLVLAVMNFGTNRAKNIADVELSAGTILSSIGAAAMAANGTAVSLINETFNTGQQS